MAKKKANGRGSISKRRNGSWLGQVTIGIDGDGKAIRKSFYGDTKESVKAKMNDMLLNVQTNTYFEPSKMSISEWMDTWLNLYMKTSLRATTWESYESQFRLHIKPQIGKIKIATLTTTHLQIFYNQKLSELSPRTVRYIHQVINGALEQAMKEKIITSNPAKAVRLPRLVKKEMKVLNVDQLTQFLSIAKNETNKMQSWKGRQAYPFYTAYLLELSTGLRRGELLALRWKDVDFDNNTIRICRQLVRTRAGYVITETKTALSERLISVPQWIIEEIKVFQLIQGLMKIELEGIYEDNDLIFSTVNGKPIDPKNFVRNFKGILKKAGLDESLRFHDLRHTFAVLSLRQGINVKTIQENLGHHSPAFTLEVYGHQTQEMNKDAAEKVGNYLSRCVLKDE